MISLIDRVIDRITMYRLVLWYLVALLVGAEILGVAHIIAIDPVPARDTRYAQRHSGETVGRRQAISVPQHG